MEWATNRKADQTIVGGWDSMPYLNALVRLHVEAGQHPPLHTIQQGPTQWLQAGLLHVYMLDVNPIPEMGLVNRSHKLSDCRISRSATK